MGNDTVIGWIWIELPLECEPTRLVSLWGQGLFCFVLNLACFGYCCIPSTWNHTWQNKSLLHERMSESTRRCRFHVWPVRSNTWPPAICGYLNWNQIKFRLQFLSCNSHVSSHISAAVAPWSQRVLLVEQTLPTVARSAGLEGMGGAICLQVWFQEISFYHGDANNYFERETFLSQSEENESICFLKCNTFFHQHRSWLNTSDLRCAKMSKQAWTKFMVHIFWIYRSDNRGILKLQLRFTQFMHPVTI